MSTPARAGARQGLWALRLLTVTAAITLLGMHGLGMGHAAMGMPADEAGPAAHAMPATSGADAMSSRPDHLAGASVVSAKAGVAGPGMPAPTHHGEQLGTAMCLAVLAATALWVLAAWATRRRRTGARRATLPAGCSRQADPDGRRRAPSLAVLCVSRT